MKYKRIIPEKYLVLKTAVSQALGEKAHRPQKQKDLGSSSCRYLTSASLAVSTPQLLS